MNHFGHFCEDCEPSRSVSFIKSEYYRSSTCTVVIFSSILMTKIKSQTRLKYVIQVKTLQPRSLYNGSFMLTRTLLLTIILQATWNISLLKKMLPFQRHHTDDATCISNPSY